MEKMIYKYDNHSSLKLEWFFIFHSEPEYTNTT